jgi:hypothetical protein
MEQGFQTTVDPAKAGLYRGTETDRNVLPPWVSRVAAGTTDGLAPDQATQVSDALQLAYCQPGVTAFFNFELADEPGLAGWQSGLLSADLTPKPSYDAFKDAVRKVRSGNVDCGRFTKAAVPEPEPAPAPDDDGPEVPFTGKPAKKKGPPVVVVK